MLYKDKSILNIHVFDASLSPRHSRLTYHT